MEASSKAYSLSWRQRNVQLRWASIKKATIGSKRRFPLGVSLFFG